MSFGQKNEATISVAAEDINNDGKIDLILANRNAQPNIYILDQTIQNR